MLTIFCQEQQEKQSQYAGCCRDSFTFLLAVSDLFSVSFLAAVESIR